MFDIVGRRKWAYVVSAIIIVPSILSLIIFRLQPGIDFSGGTIYELRFESAPPAEEIKRIYLSLGARDQILPNLQLTLSRPWQMTAGTDGEQVVNRTEEAIGYVIVEDVFEHYALARLLAIPETTVQRGDKVRMTSGPVILGLLPVADNAGRASSHGNLTTALQTALQANERFDVVSANHILLWSLEQGAPLEDGLTPDLILRMSEALRFNYVVVGTVKEVNGKAVLDVALLSPRLQRLVASGSVFLTSP